MPLTNKFQMSRRLKPLLPLILLLLASIRFVSLSQSEQQQQQQQLVRYAATESVVDENLTSYLLADYDSSVAPSNYVHVFYSVVFEQVLSINEASQVMTSSMNFILSWDGTVWTN